MKADLHIHSRFSTDAWSSPQEIVSIALQKGIDCICIADHGEIKGAIEAMKISYDKNLLVVPGIEILSQSGDVLGINIKHIIPDRRPLAETVMAIQKQGGLAVIPHPFGWPRAAGFWGDRQQICAAGVNGVEVFNASVIFKDSNQQALDFSLKNNLVHTAGSDAHRAEFVGRGYIETQKNIHSVQDLLAEIIAGRVEAKGSKLSLWELLRNGSKGNFGRLMAYCRNN